MPSAHCQREALNANRPLRIAHGALVNLRCSMTAGQCPSPMQPIDHANCHSEFFLAELKISTRQQLMDIFPLCWVDVADAWSEASGNEPFIFQVSQKLLRSSSQALVCYWEASAISRVLFFSPCEDHDDKPSLGKQRTCDARRK